MTRLEDLPLFDKAESQAEAQSQEAKVYSVSQVNRQVKGILEGRFALVWIRGEISNFKAHTSGHHYFSLKDQKSQISAVMFRGYNRQLKFRPENGKEVIIRGRVTVYEPRGNYQIFCETMEPVGAGALQQAFERLKQKLKSEGLFEANRKKQLPALPSHVALITSPTGAAVKDMLNVLGRRFRGLEITVVPCKVQGKGAENSIVSAFEQVKKLHVENPVDVVICGRGGGSIEDLWAFNEEVLARTISNFEIPVVSAVGHEIDFTICDFVADLRAPTPSAAAELVVKNAAEVLNQVEGRQRRLSLAMKQRLTTERQRVQRLESLLVDPKRYLQDLGIRCDDLLQRLELAMTNYLATRKMQVSLLSGRLERPSQRIARERQKVEHLRSRLQTFVEGELSACKSRLGRSSALLDSLSPLKVVDRGYSIVTKSDQVVKSCDEVKPGDSLTVRLSRGQLLVTADKVIKEKKK